MTREVNSYNAPKEGLRHDTMVTLYKARTGPDDYFPLCNFGVLYMGAFVAV